MSHYAIGYKYKIKCKQCESHLCILQVTCRIIDLGMAKRVINDKVVTEDIFGTNGYHAPEVLFKDTYDFRADIFMLGVSFCVLVSVHKIKYFS